MYQLYLGIVGLELASGMIAGLVAYYAFKAYRLSGRGRVLALSLGFLALASSLVTRGCVLASILALKPPKIVALLATNHVILASAVAELVAYLLIASGYYTELRGKGFTLPAAAPLAFSANMASSVVGIILLLYTCLSQAFAQPQG